MGKWGQGKIQKECDKCKISFFARVDRPGKFCSWKCQRAGRKPKEKTFIHFFCKTCGIPAKRRNGNGGTNEYCTIKCMAESRGKKMRKENHPKWKGGISKRNYSSRKIILDKKKQIGNCEKCGSTKNLEGHHRRSYATDLEDIEILCAECHALQHPRYKHFIRNKYAGKKTLDK